MPKRCGPVMRHRVRLGGAIFFLQNCQHFSVIRNITGWHWAPWWQRGPGPVALLMVPFGGPGQLWLGISSLSALSCGQGVDQPRSRGWNGILTKGIRLFSPGLCVYWTLRKRNSLIPCFREEGSKCSLEWNMCTPTGSINLGWAAVVSLEEVPDGALREGLRVAWEASRN